MGLWVNAKLSWCIGARLTDTRVHHVHLKRVVLLANAVLRGGVEMELGQLELSTRKGSSSVDDHLDGGSEVQEFDGTFLDGHSGLLGRELDRIICRILVVVKRRKKARCAGTLIVPTVYMG